MARLTVRLTPRGGRDRIEGWMLDDTGRPLLKARVAAPPVDGQANAALERLIARHLGRPGGAVRVIGGQGARIKQLEIAGAEVADFERAFGPAP